MKTLMKLVNNDTKPEPVVRDLSNGVSGWQAQAVEGGERVNLGRCLALGMGQVDKSKHHKGPLNGWPAGGLCGLNIAPLCHTVELYLKY